MYVQINSYEIFESSVYCIKNKTKEGLHEFFLFDSLDLAPRYLFISLEFSLKSQSYELFCLTRIYDVGHFGISKPKSFMKCLTNLK